MGMEVAVERASGRITVERVVCAHDCGQIINPDGVRAQVEGNILQTLSRVLMEEVKFDRSRVTSVDWASYPILRFSEVPKIEIELIDRPTEKPVGAGEAACYAGRRRARQRGVRRDRRAAAHRSVHARAREGGFGRAVRAEFSCADVVRCFRAICASACRVSVGGTPAGVAQLGDIRHQRRADPLPGIVLAEPAHHRADQALRDGTSFGERPRACRKVAIISASETGNGSATI